ncbi:kelch-like protein 8 isoform X2 [Stegodyphus dumicola]|nr:kelch-like protein 8 isoform X2 [Stegodyphus dumicola]
MHPSTGKVERCKSTETERRLREKRGNCAKLEKHAEGNKSGKEELNHSGTDSECEVKVISTHRRKESPLHSSITEKQNFSFISQQFSSNNQKHNSECTSNNIQSSSDHTREQKISVQRKSPETIEKKSNFRRCHEISRESDSDSDQYVKTQQTRNTANPEDETIPGSGSVACDTLDTSIKEELVRCAFSPSIKHAHARMSQKTEPVKITNRNRGAKSQSTTKFKTAYEDGNEILPETSGGTEKSCRKKEKRNSDNGDNRSKSSIASDTVSSRSYMEENMFIFVIGGMNQNNPKSGKGGVVLHLDVKKNKWKQTSSLPQPRHNHGAVYYDNFIYVVGGCDPYDTVEQCRYIPRRSCFKFDLRTQTWSNLADMHFPRYDHSLIALDGLMYAIGGQSDGERLHKTMEIYDFKRDRWQLHTSEMCCGKKAMGIAALNCRIWVGGGLIQPDNEIDLQATAQIDCYDPKENR